MSESSVPAALPVFVEAADGSITRHVEGVLGWQPLTDASDPLVQPRLAVVDVTADPPAGLPTVLVVGPDDDPLLAATSGRHAAAVLSWPDQASRLGDVAAQLLRGGESSRVVPSLMVGAAAGGVGATTVALGIAALASWDLGAESLALVSGWAPCPDLPVVAPDDLAAPTLWRTAPRLPGTPRLRGLRLSSPLQSAMGPDHVTGPGRVVVECVAELADLLVLRPDGPGLDAIRRSPAGTLVVVGAGPATRRDVETAAKGRRIVRLDEDPRIPRAAMTGRVPADLPGSWLDRLRHAVT